MAAALLQQLDGYLEKVTSSWNVYTTILCVLVAGFAIYPLIFTTDADTHYFLLARQSSASRVRKAGETSVYRSPEIAYGYPLKSGLGVKDAATPKWSMGRDGDLRDIWRRATAGQVGEDGKNKTNPGKVFTLLGKEEVVETSFKKLSTDLTAIGSNLKKQKVSRVAIYLSNTPELLVALFATLFYGQTPILISQELPLETLARVLRLMEADALIVGAGSVPLNGLIKHYSGLKEVIWVVPKTSRHLDWNEVAEGEGGKTGVAVWHEIVDEVGDSTDAELPSNESAGKAPNVLIVSPATDKVHETETMEYTQTNLTSATAAQISSLAHRHRISSNDLLLPLLPLTDCYTLTITLSALYANASLALTPVTGQSASFDSAFNFSPQIAPTIIIIDPIPLYLHVSRRQFALQQSTLKLWANYRHNRLLSHLKDTGAMPSRSSLTIPQAQDSLRLIYTMNASHPSALNDLRIFTGARVVVGLTDPRVAGAITQTHILDYRATDESEAHFGPPLSCLELKLKELPGYTVEDDEIVRLRSAEDKKLGGNLVVKGPAVVKGVGITEDVEVVLHERGVFRMRDDGTVAAVYQGPRDPHDDKDRQIEVALKDALGQ